MYHQVRFWNKKNIKNYLEIYIETDIKKLIKNKKKSFYRAKLINIVGKNIKAELPKRINNIADAESFLSVCSKAEFKVNNIEKKPIKKTP